MNITHYRFIFLFKETDVNNIVEKFVPAHWLERKDRGVPVPKTLQTEMIVMRNELGLAQYKFSFE